MNADESQDSATGSSRYQLIEPLGAGGFGEVWLAQHNTTRRMVALKFLSAALQIDEVNFRREIESQGKIHHPNIVEVIDAGLWDDESHNLYIALRFVEGGTLRAKLGEETLREPRVAVNLVAVIARALEYAHQQSVLHCDLKPENILLDRQGTPYVCDFGVAYLLGRGNPEPSAASLPYMAPEQCIFPEPGHVEINRWTDVFGLGAVLYELLTGRPPYEAASLHARRESFDRHATLPRPGPTGRRSGYARGTGVDIELDTACMHALAINPYARYGSAGALADDLQRWLRGEPILGPARQKPGLGKRLKCWKRRHGIPALAFILSAVAVIGVPALSALIAVEVAKEWVAAFDRELAHVIGKSIERAIASTKDTVSNMAMDSQMIEFVASRSHDAFALARIHQHVAWSGLESEFCTFDSAGCSGACWPAEAAAAATEAHEWWGSRDYFRCARALARDSRRAACLSRVFISKPDGKATFAFASPVYSDASPDRPNSNWIGVFTASVAISNLVAQFQAVDLVEQDRGTDYRWLPRLLPIVTRISLVGRQDTPRDQVVSPSIMPVCELQRASARATFDLSDDLYAYSMNDAAQRLTAGSSRQIRARLRADQLSTMVDEIYPDPFLSPNQAVIAAIYNLESVSACDGIEALVVWTPVGSIVRRIVLVACALGALIGMCLFGAVATHVRARTESP
jgi:serine/threonine-protein kinase